MKKLGILVFSILLLSLSACKHGLSKNEGAKNVTISISQERTVSPVEWDLADISEWNIVITPEEESVISTVSRTTSARSEVFTIPAGYYNVTVSGESSNPQSEYFLYGEVSSFYVDPEKDDNGISVYVSLKKKGTGSFAFNLNLRNEDLYINDAEYEEVSTNGYGAVISSACGINAYLYPVDGSEEDSPVKLLVRGTKKTDDVSPDGYFAFTITGSDIPSGFYTLVITKIDSAERVLPLNLKDSLIEIADGLTTTLPDYDDKDFAGDIYRTFYVTNDSYCDLNNGLSPRYKKSMPAMFEWLEDNRDQWQYVDLYFTTGDITDVTNIYEVFRRMTPEIDLDYHPTRDNYAEGITVYVDGKIFCEIENNRFYFNDFYGNPYFWFTSDEEKTLSLDMSNLIDSYDSFSFMTDNVTLECNGLDVETSKTFNTYREDFGSVYDEKTSVPYMILNFKSQAEISPDMYKITYTKLYCWAVTKDYAAYPVLAAENQIKCYTDTAGSASVGIINKLIPSFNIEGTDAIFISDGGDIEYAYKAVSDDLTEFNEGTTFKWYINGTLLADENTSSISVSLQGNNPFKMGENVITCVASYNGEVGSVIFGVNCYAGVGNVYYGYRDWTTDNYLQNGSLITKNKESNPNEILTAFCYDRHNNLYLSLFDKESGAVKIEKYEYVSGLARYNDRPYTFAYIQLNEKQEHRYSPYIPSRMTTDGNSIYYTVTGNGEHDTNCYHHFDFKGNKIYYVTYYGEKNFDESQGNLPQFIEATDFETVTALAYNPTDRQLYVAGCKVKDEKTDLQEDYVTEIDEFGSLWQKKDEDGNFIIQSVSITTYNYEYFVNGYKVISVDSGKTLSAGSGKVISYTDDDVMSDDTSLLLIDYENAFDHEHFNFNVRTANYITDLVAANGSIYAVKTVFTSYKQSNFVYVSSDEKREYSSFKISQFYGSILCLKDGALKTIDVPHEYRQMRLDIDPEYDSVNIIPARILAIKPKELTFCSATGGDVLFNLDLESEQIKAMKTPEAMSFDDIIYGSGSFDVTDHLYTNFTAETYENR